MRIREGQLDAADARPYLAASAPEAADSTATAAAPPADPYLGLERRLRVPLLRLGDRLFEPFVAFLSRRGVSPHAVSGLQVLLAASAFYALPRWPRGTLLLWLTALTTDGVDGMLARRSRRASSFGMLWDQTCDHAREALVVASLAHYGLVAPLWAVFYAFAYPALNVVLYLANRYAVPLPLAPRHYLTFYPALIAYLACGTDLLTPALALATAGMAAGCGVALWRLHRVMP